jgi:hypothetical protein
MGLLFQPGDSIEHLRSWSEMQRQGTSAEAALRLFDVTFNVQVEASASRVMSHALDQLRPAFLARFGKKKGGP